MRLVFTYKRARVITEIPDILGAIFVTAYRKVCGGLDLPWYLTVGTGGDAGIA